MKIRLAFDLHGVIMHLMPIMQKYYREVVGFELIETDRFNFDFPDHYKASRCGGDIARAIRTMAVPFAKPVRGSIQSLRQWKNKGNKIVIVTASAPTTMDANNEWLKKYFSLAQDYTIHRVSHQEGKLKKLMELGITHFVDDRFKTCNELADYMTEVFLMDAPCNRGRTPKANVTRVRSLQKVISCLS